MTGRLLGCWADGSSEWHAARRWRVGGSEIGQIMGWSPFGDRDDLLAAKHDDTRSRETAAMLRGTVLEPAILDWGHRKHGYNYSAVGTYLHPQFDWMLYNPDGITTDGILIECKTTTDRCEERGWGRAGTSQIPLHYRAQVAWGMAVLDIPEAHVLVLEGAHNGRPTLAFSRYIIRRDRALEMRLIAAGFRFINDLRSIDIAA